MDIKDFRNVILQRGLASVLFNKNEVARAVFIQPVVCRLEYYETGLPMEDAHAICLSHSLLATCKPDVSTLSVTWDFKIETQKFLLKRGIYLEELSPWISGFEIDYEDQHRIEMPLSSDAYFPKIEENELLITYPSEFLEYGYKLTLHVRDKYPYRWETKMGKNEVLCTLKIPNNNPS